MTKVLNFEEVQNFLNKLGTTEFIANGEKFDISDQSQPSGIMHVVDLLAGAFPDNWSLEECICWHLGHSWLITNQGGYQSG